MLVDSLRREGAVVKLDTAIDIVDTLFALKDKNEKRIASLEARIAFLEKS